MSEMKTVGLITEYNPFHNGHLHHIKLAKELTKADYVVVVMSGNFMQRGTPGIIDKYKRTAMALQCGADLVVELPCVFSTASAEFFALGGVAILHKMGCIDTLCFGSECGDLTLLEKVAQILVHEPHSYKEALKLYLKEGLSFPVARKKALLHFFTKQEMELDLEHILSMPNNILAIEYIKALIKLKSNIKPVTIKRIVSDYHDTQITDAICSASAIRTSLFTNGIEDFKEQVPSCVYEIVKEEYKKSFPIYMNDFSTLLKYKLLLSHTKPYDQYLDISNALSNAIENHLPAYKNAESFIGLLKNKQYTLTRINRSLTHILLDIQKEQMQVYADNNYAQYIRILGFQRQSKELLTQLKKSSNIPIISKVANYKQILNPLGIRMLEQDILAADIYNTVVTDKFNTNVANEFRQQLIIL